jgi:uncharacterized protein (DUF924 family)
MMFFNRYYSYSRKKTFVKILKNSKMGFGLLASDVAVFAARPFIHAALSNPRCPISVLSFFLGVDYRDVTLSDPVLRSGTFLYDMTPFWFGGHVDYDALCQKSFQELVREAGTRKLLQEEEWNSTVDGMVAQLILCDQLSRNCFRGTEEAFAYDDTSLFLAKSLASQVIFPSPSSESATLKGFFYPTYSSFVVTTLMHSEDVGDHKLGFRILDWAVKNTDSSLKEKWWNGQIAFLQNHTDVLDRFGRYPHRNHKKGRMNTQEEEEWLAKVDELPGWAKSQM